MTRREVMDSEKNVQKYRRILTEEMRTRLRYEELLRKAYLDAMHGDPKVAHYVAWYRARQIAAEQEKIWQRALVSLKVMEFENRAYHDSTDEAL
jgi:hypothetical protein